jgi:hypothetical protein
MDKYTVLFHCDLLFDVADIALAVTKGVAIAGILGGLIEIDHQAQLAGIKTGEYVILRDLARLTSTRKFSWRQKCVKGVIRPQNR